MKRPTPPRLVWRLDEKWRRLWRGSPNVITAPSRLGRGDVGRGAFATKSFAPQAIIGDVSGVFHAAGEFESDYCMEVGPDWVLDPAPPFRFMNHSCEPNCRLVFDDRFWGGVMLQVEALTWIDSGSELFIDYAWPAECAIPCSCGRPTCRGWIVDKNELALMAPQSSLRRHTDEVNGDVQAPAIGAR